MRSRILTISTLAFIVMICFITDGQLLFGEGGIVNGEINDADLLPFQISIYKLSSLSGLEELHLLKLMILTFALSFFMILANQFVVLSSIYMWFIYWVVCNSGIGYAYGADYFVIFLLYYNILLSIFRNKKNARVNLILILQLHLCVVYFFAGLGKMVGHNWWDGNALWSVINVYGVEFIRAKAEMVLEFSFALKILSIGTFMLELLYPILIFFKRTRKITLLAVLSLHLGIAIIIGLYTFSLVMITMNLIAFGHYIEWKNPFKDLLRNKMSYKAVPA